MVMKVHCRFFYSSNFSCNSFFYWHLKPGSFCFLQAASVDYIFFLSQIFFLSLTVFKKTFIIAFCLSLSFLLNQIFVSLIYKLYNYCSNLLLFSYYISFFFKECLFFFNYYLRLFKTISTCFVFFFFF
jgi:hypothetical protein